MYLLVILLPLLNFIIGMLFGKIIGTRNVSFLSTFNLFFSFLISVFLFVEIAIQQSVTSIHLFNWINCDLLVIKWGFLFDSLSSVMLLIITSISFLVHLYSIEYMMNDPHLSRFMSFLSLFTFFMLMLVTADNMVQLFLGWEGVGIASYLLINFWFTRIAANKSAIKALIVNRVGDFWLILAIGAIFMEFKSLEFPIIFSTGYFFQNQIFDFFFFELDKLTVISILLFMGAVGKSAQLGLHIWLPDAMEGPTPVSALIHAATMVTAGVFLIVRCSPLLEYAPKALFFITIIGSLTAFMAATTGVLQNDLKKIIAYSTCSQLGYMVLACGLSNYSVALFHLFNHAFFKALLFLSAGAIIHSLQDEQDIRKMGSLYRILPFTYIMVFIGSMSLMGIPFLTGFYSKDVILEISFASFIDYGFFAYTLAIISAFFTAFYSFRLLYFVFFSGINFNRDILKHVHETSFFMGFSLFVLSFSSIFFGFFFKDFFIGLGSISFNNSIFNKTENILIYDSEFLPFYLKMLPVIFSLTGSFFSWYLYNILYNKIFFLLKTSFYKVYKNVYFFFSKKWYFDVIINNYVSKYYLIYGYYFAFKSLDRGLLELLGSVGISRVLWKFVYIFIRMHSGIIYHYAFIMFLGCLFLVNINIMFNFWSFLEVYSPAYILLFIMCCFIISIYNIKDKMSIGNLLLK